MKQIPFFQCDTLKLFFILLALSACTSMPAPVATLESFSPAIVTSPTMLSDRPMPTASPIPHFPAISAPAPSTELTQVKTTSEDEPILRLSPVTPVTIYSGPGFEFTPVGILEAGPNAVVTERGEDTWLKIACPPNINLDSCWVFWEMNKVYAYEGDPITLSIPDPSTLEIESTNTSSSPD